MLSYNALGAAPSATDRAAATQAVMDEDGTFIDFSVDEANQVSSEGGNSSGAQIMTVATGSENGVPAPAIDVVCPTGSSAFTFPVHPDGTPGVTTCVADGAPAAAAVAQGAVAVSATTPTWKWVLGGLLLLGAGWLSWRELKRRALV